MAKMKLVIRPHIITILLLHLVETYICRTMSKIRRRIYYLHPYLAMQLMKLALYH